MTPQKLSGFPAADDGFQVRDPYARGLSVSMKPATATGK